MSINSRTPKWILPWSKRQLVSKKYRDTENKIKECKLNGDWACVKRLKYILRNVWWGIKRYR